MTDRTLPSVWDLDVGGETVPDVESVVAGAIHAERWTWELEVADEAELRAHLLGEVVVLAARYAPPADATVSRRPDERGTAARAWLFQRLRWAAVDWSRAFYGRNGQHRPLPEHDFTFIGGREWESTEHRGDLDARNGVAGGGSYGAPGEVPGHSGDDGEDALTRLLEDGDRRLLREIEALGLGPPPGARGSSPRARRDLARLDRLRLERVRRREREAVAA